MEPARDTENHPTPEVAETTTSEQKPGETSPLEYLIELVVAIKTGQNRSRQIFLAMRFVIVSAALGAAIALLVAAGQILASGVSAAFSLHAGTWLAIFVAIPCIAVGGFFAIVLIQVSMFLIFTIGDYFLTLVPAAARRFIRPLIGGLVPMPVT